MATSPTKPFRMVPLQRLTVKPIDDPAEQAALEERLKRSEKAASGDSTSGGGIPGIEAEMGTSPSLIAGVKQVSESERSTPTRRSRRKRR